MANGAKKTGGHTYLGRKPTYSRAQLAMVQELLGRETIGIAAGAVANLVGICLAQSPVR
jgi:hypothetical protein